MPLLLDTMSSDTQETRLLRKVIIAQAAQCAIQGLALNPADKAHKGFLTSLRYFELPGHDITKPLSISGAALDVLQRLAFKLGINLSDEQKAICYRRLSALLMEIESIRGSLATEYPIEDKRLAKIFSTTIGDTLLDSDLILQAPEIDEATFNTNSKDTLVAIEKVARFKLSEATSPLPCAASLQTLTKPITFFEVRIDAPSTVTQEVFKQETVVNDDSCVTFLCKIAGPSEEAKNAQKMRSNFERASASNLISKRLQFSEAAIVSSYFKNRALVRRNAFIGAQFGNSDEHFISLRDLSTERRGDCIERIKLFTGLCLWSTATASAQLLDGTKVPLVDPKQPIGSKVASLQISDDLSLYETDSLKRLGGLIRDISAVESRPVEVLLNIPHFEYYLYLIDALRDGHISLAIFRDWCAKVDQRSKRITAEFSSQIGASLSIRAVDPLSQLSGLIMSILESGYDAKRHNVSEACSLLANASLLWREILSLSAERPTNWTDINTLGYACAVLQEADEMGTALIAVENRHEARIYEKVEHLNERLKKRISLAVLLSHEQVICRMGTRRYFDNLYFLPA